MTIQHDSTGPGIEDYRSSRFVCTVNAVEQYVYGYERAAAFDTIDWNEDDLVELSWLKFGTDEKTTVSIALADASPVTSFTVYPKNLDLSPSVVGGILYLSVPPDVDLLVDVNGNTAECLMIFSTPLADAVPGTTTDFTTLGLTVSSISLDTDYVTFTGSHGLTTGQKIVFTSDALDGMPSPLVEAHPYEVEVQSATQVSLFDAETKAAIVFTDTGSGTIKAFPNFYTNASSALYFPAGRHVIGWGFAPAANVEVYLDRGAVVVGGFALSNIDGVVIHGPGHISGEFDTWENIVQLPFQQFILRAAFNNSSDSNTLTTNEVRGVTCFAQPGYTSAQGAWSLRNVQTISPWTPNTGELQVGRKNTSGTVFQSEVVRCFAYAGDDVLRGVAADRLLTIQDCHIHNSSSACIYFGYEPFMTSTGGTAVIQNIDCVNRSPGTDPNDQFSHIVKCWMDGWPEASSLGVYNVTMSNIRVWGAMNGQLFSLRNYSPTWDEEVRQQYGNIANWTIDGFYAEKMPGKLSILAGRDVSNTPHDITFTDIEINGISVTQDNYEDFFTLNEFVYDITWDEVAVPEPPVGPPVVVPDPTDPTTFTVADSYCTRAFANAYHANYGNPSTWTSATDAQKDLALRIATRAADERYSLRWRGTQAASDQSLAWPRTDVYDQAGYLVSDNIIPLALQRWTARAALLHLQGYDLAPDTQTTADIASETLSAGGLSKSVTYVGSKPATTQFPSLDKMLVAANLITAGGGWGYATA